MAERLKRFIAIIKRRRTPIGIVLLLAAVVGLGAFLWGDKASASDYITAKVDRGNVEVTVSATGTVQAVTTVQVGSQVSGTVEWLGADFNSQVHTGQVIARLDPAIFQAQLENSRANVLNAEAAVQAAETEINNQKANLQASKANQEVLRVQRDDAAALVKRYQELQNVLSGRDLEAAQAQANAASARYEQGVAQVTQVQSAGASAKAKLEQAKASVAQAKAQLKQSQANLDHSIISSPIDGVVVSRSVDVGQTVAASLSAPTLFTIANDLTKMQVLASIDEADVGQIRAGIKANFTVDAFPGEIFTGNISQLRLNAQNTQNVVTYSAVIDVSNPQLKLRPGMTANITISVAKRDNVLTVPNAALRFRPSDKEQEAWKERIEARRKELIEAGRQAQNNPEGQPAPAQDQGQQQANAQGQGNDNRRQGERGQASNGGMTRRGDGQGNRMSGQGRGDGQGNREGMRQRGEGGGNFNREAWMARGGGNFNREAWRQRREAAQAAGGDTPRNRAEGEQRSGADGQRRRSEGGQGSGSDRAQSGSAQGQRPPGGAGPTFQGFSGSETGTGARRQWQVIWVLSANKSIEPRLVRTGLTNGRVTEIVAGDLQEGDTIIIGQNEPNATRPAQQTGAPFGQQQRPGGPGRR